MWSRVTKRLAIPVALGTVGAVGITASLYEGPEVPSTSSLLKDTLLPKMSMSSLLTSTNPSMLMTMSSDNFEDELEPDEQVASVDHEDNIELSLKNVYVDTAEHADLRIFGGTGNTILAREIASHLNVQIGRAKVSQHSDGEIAVQVLDNVRGRDCFVVNSLCGPNPHDQLMELLLLISTLRRSSAGRIVAVLPYTAYVRQLDGSSYDRTFLPAADIARMLEAVGVDHVVTVDLHRPQFIGFFKKAVCENLDTYHSLLPYLSSKGMGEQRKVSVVAPVGATKRATRLHELFNRNGIDSSIAFTYLVSKVGGGVRGTSEDKLHHAQLERTSEDVKVVGDVSGRDCVLVDDMIDSGSRVSAAAEALKMQGAKNIYAYATHGLLTGNAIQRIEDAPIREAIVFDTIPMESKQSADIRQLSSAGLIAETIKRIHQNQSTVNFNSL